MIVSPRAPNDWTRVDGLASDREFWRVWLGEAGPVLGATSACLMRPAQGDAAARVLLRWGRAVAPAAELPAAVTPEDPLVLRPAASSGENWFALRVPWDEPEEEPLAVAGLVPVAAWAKTGEDAWRDRLLLWAASPGRRRRARELATLRDRADELAGAIELTARLRAQESFAAVTLEACNQLALRHHADRVALGWWREPYIRLLAVSQHNRIEPRMAAVGAQEAAMEEAVERDAAVLWPVPPADEGADEGAAPCPQHRALAQAQGWMGLCTLPLRQGGRVVGAVTWHRSEALFNQEEAGRFALALDLIGPLLADREARSGNIFRRWKRAAELALERHANLRHPWPKLGAAVVALALAASLIIHVPYRVEAEFTLRPAQQMVMTAPFDGFIAAARTAPGMIVPAGGELFALDDTALRLEAGEVLAETSRYAREREQAEAAGNLADMRVAQARQDQAEARLSRLRRQIGQTVVRAPFTGTTLDDGRLSERLGAPVRQSDALMRFARMDGLYFELAVPEADAPLMRPGRAVEIAFSGRPADTQHATVTLVEPEAVTKANGAFFTVRAAPVAAQPAWWRPGMTGIAKVITERRSLFDLFTRRLVDWLRLKLWW